MVSTFFFLKTSLDMFLIFLIPLFFCWVYTLCETIHKTLFLTLYQAYSTSGKIFYPACCPVYFPLSLIPCACPFILSNTQIEPGYSEIQSNLVPSPNFSRTPVLMSIFWVSTVCLCHQMTGKVKFVFLFCVSPDGCLPV